MARKRKPYWEIRLEFNTEEERNQFEQEVEELLKKNNYSSRREFLREKIRELRKGQ